MRFARKGERMLASAVATSGEVIAGSRDALHITSVEPAGTTRIPWEQIEAADWDSETDTFRVSEVGGWGEQRREHAFELPDPGRVLELVRERVTASVVIQRHYAVSGRRGLRVIARRAPRGDQPIAWFFEYDEGVDPDSPEVREVARAALASCRDEVGPSISRP